MSNAKVNKRVSFPYSLGENLFGMGKLARAPSKPIKNKSGRSFVQNTITTIQPHDPKAWQLALIEQALSKVQTGNAKFASHEAVTEWLKSWGSETERDAPICK